MLKMMVVPLVLAYRTGATASPTVSDDGTNVLPRPRSHAITEGLEENFDDRVGCRMERNEIGYALV